MEPSRTPKLVTAGESVTPVGVPTSDLDLYCDAVLDDPYPAYAELRDAGPIVWMSRLKAYAVPRYGDVRRALVDWETYSSAWGVGFHPRVNDMTRDTIFTSDPPEHDSLRRVMNQLMSNRELSKVREVLRERASQHVTRLAAQDQFDAVTDLTWPYVQSAMVDLAGVPSDRLNELLPNAHAAFEALGPANERCIQSLRGLRRLFDFVERVAVPGRLTATGLGMGIYRAAASGEISDEDCPSLMTSFVWAGLDTTISAITNAIWLLGQYPEQWARVRSDPTLIPAAFNEALRVESPLQGLTRFVSREVGGGGVTLPSGTRVLLMFGSANRDDRQYDEPDSFDISRNPRDHLAFGYGIHRCVGLGLARLCGYAVIEALSDHVEQLRIVGARRRLNNLIRGFGSLKVERPSGGGRRMS